MRHLNPPVQAGLDPRSTRKSEVAVAKRNMPEFAWPTAVLAVSALAGYATTLYFSTIGVIPLWAGCLISTVIIYVCYTPLHDASHSAIVPRNRKFRWVNTALGMAVAIPLWMFFYTHRREHFVHHAKTNTPEDPDLWAKGSFYRVTGVQIPWLLVNYFNPVALYRSCRKLKRHERCITLVQFAAYSTAIVVVVGNGYALELLMLWLVPWFVGLHIMQTMFGWFPHHDHRELGRYRDTRISLWPCAEWLTLQQNLHLIHHMLPTVPFYRYRAVFDEIRPLLVSHDVRIEGFWPTPDRELSGVTSGPGKPGA